MNTMQEFHDFMNYSALVDLPLRGGDYTRSRSDGNAVCSGPFFGFFGMGGAIPRISSSQIAKAVL